MPTPRYQYHGLRRTAPTCGERTTPPDTGATCDKCGQTVSRYNPHARCWACIDEHGEPTRRDPNGRVSRHHPNNCQCTTIRVPALDADGVHRRRGSTPIWLIEVTCPGCNRIRLIRTDGLSQHPCHTNYIRWCHPCAKKGKLR